MPRFSVVMPVYSELEPKLEGNAGHLHYRGKTVQRAIKSIINQQFPDWELILVNDGIAEDITPAILQKFADSDRRIKIVTQENLNRAFARNNGMKHATGEWLCWLDCDDEYASHYLRELDQAIKDYPNYKIFNFGSLIYWADHRSTTREVFCPETEGDGHVWFRAGHIGAGSFIFRRDLWDSDLKYHIPNEAGPYDFAAESHFDLKLDPVADEFQYFNTPDPEQAFTDGVKRQGLSLGNPWGDDMLQFYLLTRDNRSMPLDVLLYIQYPRSNEDQVYSHFGEIYEA